MRTVSLAAGLVAAAALLSPAAGLPAKNKPTGDSTCAYRIGFQLIGYLNTWMEKGGDAYCTTTEGVGYQAGIIKFTVQYGSALSVVDTYVADPEYKQEFKDVYATLKTMSEAKSTATTGMDGFCPAWGLAAKNSTAFFNAQVKMARAMYEKPALSVAKEQGVTPKYPITKVFLTQLAVVNGFGDPERSLDAIMKATNELFTQDVDGDSGSQITVGSYKVDEIVWLKELLIKAAKMSHPVFSRTVRILSDIVYEGNYKLSKTTKFQGFNWEPVTLECTKFTGSTTIESPAPE